MFKQDMNEINNIVTEKHMCGACDICSKVFFTTSDFLEIDGKYKKSRFNIQLCDDQCLENFKKKYPSLQKFNFSRKLDKEKIEFKMKDFTNMFWFTLSYPWAIGKSAPYIIQYIESIEDLEEISEYESKFLENCYEYQMIDR